MSVDHMTIVFRLDLETNQKFVLLCLADNAGEEGICYPGIKVLSRKTSMSERTVQRALRQLFDAGIIQSFWGFTDKIRHKKVRHFRLALAGVPEAPMPNYENCPKELRYEVIKIFECTCQYCAKPGDETNGPDGAAWHIDRVVPGSRGGQYVAANVTLSCRHCNISKGAKLAPEGICTLGAKIDGQGCQSSEDGVPNKQNDGAQLAPNPSGEPSGEPSEKPSEKPQAAKRGSRKVPEGWWPSSAMIVTIMSDPKCAGIDLDREVAKMRNHEFKAPRKDWDKTLHNWCLTAGGSRSAPAKVDAAGKPVVHKFYVTDEVSGNLDLIKIAEGDLKPWELEKLRGLQKKFKSKTIFYLSEIRNND